MPRNCLICLLVIISLSSCTGLLSTNIPGTVQKSLPQEWVGKYEAVVEMPDDEPVDTSIKYVTIESRRITFKSDNESVSYSLDDSLRYSVSGQNKYLSVLQPHGLYFIMKVIKTGPGLEVHFLLPEDDDMEDLKKEDFEKYFEKVQKVTKKDNIYFKVTIIEKKLDDFFKSPLAFKNFVKLSAVK